LSVFLLWRPLADLLGHEAPTLLGMVVATLAVPAVVAADTIDKRVRARHRGKHVSESPRTFGSAAFNERILRSDRRGQVMSTSAGVSQHELDRIPSATPGPAARSIQHDV
jgi:hypothetical protein